MLMRRILCCAVPLAVLAAAPGLLSAPPPAPASIIGFELGTDYKIAHYEQILEYFRALDEASDRVLVKTIGTSTLGRPMIVALISSEDNLRRMERYRQVNRRLALARGLTNEEARRLSREGLTTVWIDGGLHASELAGSQFTPELAYWLASDDSPEARRIRQNVLLLLMPNMNPDGLDIVAEWYEDNLGTAFETAPLPRLYHHYIGHDNNRDWYAFTQAETKAAANVFYHEWFPQIIYNHHQTGPFPGRIWLPPAIDPLNPHVDPLMVASFSHMGQYMLKRFMEEEKPGVSTAIGYRVAWAAGFLHAAPQLHNMLGLFTETALYRYATPHCYTDEEIGETFSRGIRLSTRERSMRYPVPWKGGCWRLRDAMDYMLTGSKAVLDAAARLKEDYLFNTYRMGKRQIARGEAGEDGPFAYVIDPAEQHDPAAAVELLKTLRQGGVEIRRAERGFRVGRKQFAEGTYVIPPQAFRPFVVDLMERKHYPDRFDFPGGPPERPYDLTGYNLPDQFGVRVHRIERPFEFSGPSVETIASAGGAVDGTGAEGFLLTHASNRSFLAANRLLSQGASLAWTKAPADAAGKHWPAGTFIVRGVQRGPVEGLAREVGVDFYGLESPLDVPTAEIHAPRVGIYQSYVANAAEGWTRWVLEQFGFRFETLHDADIRGGDLARFDILLLPDQDAEAILNGHRPLTMPEDYVGGVGSEGAAALAAYVSNGGWLMAFHRSVAFVAAMLGLPVRNAVDGVDPKRFYVPGSLIRFHPDPSDPLAYGMAREATALTWRHGLVMDIVPAAEEPASSKGLQRLERDLVVYARFAREHVLADGWAIGAKRFLAGKPAALHAPFGKGRVVLLGFRPDTRGQPRNAFKLLFNPLYASTVEVAPPTRPTAATARAGKNPLRDEEEQ